MYIVCIMCLFHCNMHARQLVIGRVSRSNLPELTKSKFLFPATATGTYMYYTSEADGRVRKYSNVG